MTEACFALDAEWRFTFLNELRAKGWPIVAMDLGGQEQRFGKQAEIKFDFALRALALMGLARRLYCGP